MNLFVVMMQVLSRIAGFVLGISQFFHRSGRLTRGLFGFLEEILGRLGIFFADHLEVDQQLQGFIGVGHILLGGLRRRDIERGCDRNRSRAGITAERCVFKIRPGLPIGRRLQGV